MYDKSIVTVAAIRHTGPRYIEIRDSFGKTIGTVRIALLHVGEDVVEMRTETNYGTTSLRIAVE
jgi:hypothetical protein